MRIEPDNRYRSSAGGELCQVIETVRAGLKKEWQQGAYEVILTVAGKIRDDVSQDDPMLRM